MTTFDLMICALAVWHAIEVWHHGSIFADARARLELSSGFFVDLLLCPFCLSLWVSLILTGWYLAAQYLPGTLWYQLPVVALAVCRLSNLANDLLHNWSRTPRGGESLED